MNGTGTRIYVLFSRSLGNMYIGSYAFPEKVHSWAVDRWLQKEHPGLHKTHLTWLRQPTWLRLLSPPLPAVLCSHSLTCISMLFYASPTQLLLFYSGLAIWQAQLSKVVLLWNNTALKIPYFTLASSHIFYIVLDAHSSTTMPEGTCVLTPFLMQGCGE